MALSRGALLTLGTLGLLVIGAYGLVSWFGTDYTGWLPSAVQVFTGLFLLFEVGFKVASPLHSITRAGAYQWVVMVAAGILLANGVLTLPPLGIDVALFKIISGPLVLLGAVLGAIDLYTQLDVLRSR